MQRSDGRGPQSPFSSGNDFVQLRFWDAGEGDAHGRKLACGASVFGRIFNLRSPRLCLNREVAAEAGALAQGSLESDKSFMTADEAYDGSEAEPGAFIFRLGAEKWVE